MEDALTGYSKKACWKLQRGEKKCKYATESVIM